MSYDSGYILRADGISKSFGGVQALANVSLMLRAGEVHAVVGENGAGKTTLMNILAGIIKPDKGIILFNEEKVDFNSPQDALKIGISTIHQELTMMPHLNVMENIFMGSFAKFGISSNGVIRRKKFQNATRQALDLLDLSIDPHKLVKSLSISEQQEIEIVKAVSAEARLIIMDEPNSSLTEQETKKLFSIITRLKQRGVSIFYVSHKIEEILQIADRITVLRDGFFVGTIEREQATLSLLFNMIAGREKTKTGSRENHGTDKVLLSVSGLCGRGFSNISLELFKGEVLGLYGLVGSGRSELGRALFGADKITSGTISINGQPVLISSPCQALNHGIAMVPEDRKEQALFMNLPVISNMTISHLPLLSRLNFLIRSGYEKRIINEYASLLNIKMKETNQPVKELSGGNQQKVVLARYLMIAPRILILDEPTHGIDVGAKEEVHQLVWRSAASGLGIIFISSEMPEIMSVSDRIVVLHEGHCAGIFKRGEVSGEELIACATGFSNKLTEKI